MDTSAMEVLRDGARQVLSEQKASMREIVSDMSAEALNWKPQGVGDTNSIAQMLAHALDAERFLVAAAVDQQVDRDRERHFRVSVARSQELLDLIDQIEQEVNGYLERLTPAHLGQQITRSGRSHSGTWWLLHAIEHSREHIGQAYLTKQLTDAGSR
jgi:uncharacterized damage-inducible protein DinB